MLISPCTQPPCTQVEEKLTSMYNNQRRGDSWKLNDLRALLFEHYARECKATSKPLAVEGFSRQSVKTKLQKMTKVLGDDVMNFATSSTDVDELNAITHDSQRQTSNPAHISSMSATAHPEYSRAHVQAPAAERSPGRAPDSACRKSPESSSSGDGHSRKNAKSGPACR